MERWEPSVPPRADDDMAHAPAHRARTGTFHLDPCGYPGWATADRLICLPDDGLAVPWDGRVWLNPPYGREVWTWLDRLAQHGHGTALIFARTETAGIPPNRCGAKRQPSGSRMDSSTSTAQTVREPQPRGAPSVPVAYGAEERCAACGSQRAGNVSTHPRRGRMMDPANAPVTAADDVRFNG